MPLFFTNITNDRVKDICGEVYGSYPGLQEVNVRFRRSRLKGVTMRAMPKIRTLLPVGNRRSYTIVIAQYVRDSQDIRVDDLDDDILRGWLAHELGHVVDYTSRNFVQMLIYGLKYWMMPDFAREVEHEADRIAVKHGFLDDIVATKKFLFHSPEISTGYRDRLRSLYMSIEEVKLCVPEEQRVI